MRVLLSVAVSIALALWVAMPASASPEITQPEVEALFPDYENHELQQGFQAPCVDADGKIVLEVNVNDILGEIATEPAAIAMVCQVIDYPDFTPLGPVTFSDPAIELWTFDSVPGHPDAFQLEFVVPQGSGVFTICIENTGWPEGCIDEMIDWAAYDRLSVPNEASSFSAVEALY